MVPRGFHEERRRRLRATLGQPGGPVLGEAMPPFAAVGGSVMILGAILISLEQPGATIKEFVAMNLALVFVLLQSLARAVNNVSYKWVFNQGDFDFFTVYF